MSTPLFSYGPTLFVAGPTPLSGSLTLFVTGPIPISADIPLFTSGPTGPPLTQSATLVTTGSTTGSSGVFKSAPLFVSGDNEISGAMPLFIAGDPTVPEASNMNLFVEGERKSLSNQVNLTVWNATSGVNSSTTLFVSGSGTQPGSLPLSASMNLFLDVGIRDMVPLYLMGAGDPISSGVTLFLDANLAASSGIPLCIPKVNDYDSDFVPLSVTGF